MKKKKIIILQGGRNEEHEVSLNTGAEVNTALLKLGYETESLNVNPKNFREDILFFKPDLCFNALHGPFGEDGQIQNILFELNIPFSHSGVIASTTAFDKNQTKNCLKNTEINLLKSEIINKNDVDLKLLNSLLVKYKSYIIKPLSSGSSYGVQIVNSIQNANIIYERYFKKNELYKNHDNLIIEPYIKGRELTVTVIQKDELSESIEVTEILSKNKFFDYQAKYTKGFSKHIIPAKIPKLIYNKCLNHSKIVHDTIGCNGVTRTDFIFDEINEKLYFLEINTQPGLTSVSLVPEQLKYKGIDFIELIDLLVKSAKCQK